MELKTPCLSSPKPKASKPRAVALISGGLDSMLAAKIVMEQGVHVEGINFFTGFCVEGHTQALRKKDGQKRNNALWVAETLNIKLHIIDIVEEYKRVVLNPQYGYGSNLNPCLDCKIFMVGQAKRWMEENNFDFIITGEVIGQRPKSQLKRLMPVVATQSGAEDRLLRPLCAKLLEPTFPERAGFVNREALYDFSGRNRRPQIDLANQFGIDEYAQPAGGCCFLTNKQYSEKLKDLWLHRGKRDYELDDIILLKVGRHIRPKSNFKIIMGREEGENNYLEGYCYQFPSLRPISHKGPLAIIDGTLQEEDITLAAKIVSRYCHNPIHPENHLSHEHLSHEDSSPADSSPEVLSHKHLSHELEFCDPTSTPKISKRICITPFTPNEISEDWYIEK